MRTIRLIALLGALLPLTFSPANAQQPADPLVQILDQWKERRKLPAVRYGLRWSEFSSKLRSDDPRLDKDGALPGSGMVLLDPTNRRLRLDWEMLVPHGNRLVRARHSMRFDGREQFSFLVTDRVPDAAAPEPAIREVNIAPWDRASIRWPGSFNAILWAHGLPWTAEELGARAFPFDWKDQPGRFAVTGTEEVDGRACVIVRDTTGSRKQTLRVDENRGGAIVRQSTVGSNGTVYVTTIAYQETTHGWLPSGWTEASATPGKQPGVYRRVRVESLDFNPPVGPEDFHVALRPGMEVSRPGNFYTVGEDGSLIPKYGKGAEGTGLGKAISKWLDRLGWVGVCGVLLSVVLLGAFVRLRWRSRRSASA